MMTFSKPSVNHLWTRLGLLAGLSAGVLVSLVATSPAQAQYETSADSLDMPEASEGLFRSGENSLSSPFDLYHRANLANDLTPAEFMLQQRSLLGSEIENLRMQQQELLRGQPVQTPATLESPAAEVPTTP